MKTVLFHSKWEDGFFIDKSHFILQYEDRKRYNFVIIYHSKQLIPTYCNSSNFP